MNVVHFVFQIQETFLDSYNEELIPSINFHYVVSTVFGHNVSKSSLS